MNVRDSRGSFEASVSAGGDEEVDGREGASELDFDAFHRRDPNEAGREENALLVLEGVNEWCINLLLVFHMYSGLVLTLLLLSERQLIGDEDKDATVWLVV